MYIITAYVEALNKFAHDSVEANKEKAVSAMSYLLMHHPEREKVRERLTNKHFFMFTGSLFLLLL